MKTDANIETLVQSFLAQKSIAVVGVSEKRETGCNLNYKRFKESGYRVYAVNPHISSYDGAPCYPDLQSIPEKPGAVFLMTNPKVTEQMVQQCVNLRIRHVWMHCLLGTKPGLGVAKSSVSQAAVELCKANGIAVIPGSCPAQFLKPDFTHGIMRRLWKAFGFLQIN
jgi:predicted CoA-binding protein